LITKIILTFIFVSLLGIVCLQKSYWFKSRGRQHIITAVSYALGAEVFLEVQTIDLITGKIVIADFKCDQGRYSISFSRMICRFSWTNLLRHLLFNKEKIKIKTSFFDGLLPVLGQHTLKNCSADFSFNLILNNQLRCDTSKDCLVSSSFDLCHKDKAIEHCFLFGSLVGDKGHFKIRSSQDLISVDIVKDSRFLKVSSLLDAKCFKNILGITRKMKGIIALNCLIDMNRLNKKHFPHYKLQAKFNNFFIDDFALNDFRFFAHNLCHDEHKFLVKDWSVKQDILGCRYKNEDVEVFIKGGSVLQRLYALDGVCDLVFKGHIKDNKLGGTVRSTKLNIIVPKMYNVIKQFDTEFQCDFNAQNVLVKKFFLKCHKGTVSSENILMNWDLRTPIVMPFTLSDFFFSLDKNFFVYLNGHPTLTYSADPQGVKKLSLSGTLDIDKGGVKYGFSASQKNIHSYKKEFDMHLNLDVKSKNIKMTHRFFDLNFTSKLTIQGSIKNPNVSGMIAIADGVFKFPSQNLAVTNARIYISDSEPILDINAKGNLNKHDITMRMLGPLSNPKILFESEPLLSTEQIISLLVTGSQNTALGCFFPNLFIQNLGSLLFGSASNSASRKNNYEPTEYIKQILKVLKNVRLVKVEREQTAEKGQYVLELDMSDRLRATVTNDLNFEKPKQIGLEYDLSNGVTIKGSRDRDNNIGGKLELKWKF